MLVRPCRNPRWILEKGTTQRFLLMDEWHVVNNCLLAFHSVYAVSVITLNNFIYGCYPSFVSKPSLTVATWFY